MGKDNSSLIYKESGHCINGSFSRKFCDFALLNNINATEYENDQYNVEEISKSHELLAITLNETSKGIMCDSNDLKNKIKS